MLRLEGLTAGYGARTVIRGISLEVRPGEVVALVGPNGAGKSTLLKAVAGVADTHGGRVVANGRELSGVPAHRRLALGIGFVPQGRNCFPDLTVADNLRLGVPRGTPAREAAARIDGVRAERPRLSERWNVAAGSLSGGERQELAIARVLVANPVVVLLDEPTLGMGPAAAERTAAWLAELGRRGAAVLLAEQNVRFAATQATRTLVLRGGHVVLEGGPELLAGSGLADAFLGG